MSEREKRISVSSATFIDLSHPISDGIKITKGLIEGKTYAPEIDAAIETAKELDLGLELAYRIGIDRLSKRISTSEVSINQIHGPVVWDLQTGINESVGTIVSKSTKSKLIELAKTVGMIKLANGSLKDNWNDTVNIANKLGAKNIVLHANSTEILYKNKKAIFTSNESIVVGIEPDFKRLTDKPGIIWEPNEIVRIANLTEQGVCLDTSHTGITYNSLDEMFNLYEKYKKEVKRGVVAIHFSVAIPGETRDEFFTKGTGARPLYQDTRDSIKGRYIEFYQEVMRDQSFKGPFVLEMWSFPKGNSIKDRQQAVEETLNVLNGSKEKYKTYSIS
jgi:hypothetical protein